jgi:hypothetical protein
VLTAIEAGQFQLNKASPQLKDNKTNISVNSGPKYKFDRNNIPFPSVHRFSLLIYVLLASHYYSFSQTSDTLRRALTIDFEVRPRAEFRDNFRWSISETTQPELYATQRNRFLITYTDRWFKFHASPQEIHVWGKSGKASQIGSINAFEFYVEPKINRFLSLRVGRQALSLDNGRMFSAAPWSQQGRAHEGLRIFYKNKITTDLTIAFTRPYGSHFDAAYSPVAAHQYKYLIVHHLQYKIGQHVDLTTINAIDGFEKTNEPGANHNRITNGGRLEYTHRRYYGTVSGFYQYGRSAASKTIRAYYIQPELSIRGSKITWRLGTEILSGNSDKVPTDMTKSFVPLYGVAWKFMGNMNLFTRFPADVNEKGLVNPYLFAILQVSPKLSLRADGHLFFSQHQLKTPQNLTGKYLGFENDLSVNFRPSKRIEVIYGLSYTKATRRMEVLQKIPDSQKVAVWQYLMVSYTPRLLQR